MSNTGYSGPWFKLICGENEMLKVWRGRNGTDQQVCTGRRRIPFEWSPCCSAGAGHEHWAMRWPLQLMRAISECGDFRRLNHYLFHPVCLAAMLFGSESCEKLTGSWILQDILCDLTKQKFQLQKSLAPAMVWWHPPNSSAATANHEGRMELGSGPH
jgi:hypothetical protein